MEKYRVNSNGTIKLEEWDPDDTSEFDRGKDAGSEKAAQISEELEKLQELLYAEQKRKILVVLQGMDTSGKDGVIRHVFEGVNPQGVQVASFKVPTPIEISHDYLWRIHQQAPGKGEIVIFNRSHYEDVLVVRVHQLVPQNVWSKRYEQILAFEKMLYDEGTVILKFFLNISKDEQKRRLLARIEDTSKNWKFNVDDIKERKLWSEYQKAYEDVLNKTSREWAPWFIVPSNRKWYRNLVIGAVIVQTLKSLDMQYPVVDIDPKSITIE